MGISSALEPTLHPPQRPHGERLPESAVLEPNQSRNPKTSARTASNAHVTTIMETTTHSIIRISQVLIVPDGILAANLCKHRGFAFPPTADGVYIATATESFASKESMD
jgi:hypothetical protein